MVTSEYPFGGFSIFPFGTQYARTIIVLTYGRIWSFMLNLLVFIDWYDLFCRLCYNSASMSSMAISLIICDRDDALVGLLLHLIEMVSHGGVAGLK